MEENKYQETVRIKVKETLAQGKKKISKDLGMLMCSSI